MRSPSSPVFVLDVGDCTPDGPPPPAAGFWDEPPAPDVACGAAFVRGGVVLQFPHALVRVDDDGALHEPLAAPAERLLAVNAAGTHLLLEGDRLSILDVESRRWLSDWRDDLPALLLEEVGQSVFLVDARAGSSRRLFDVTEPLLRYVTSPDGRHLWIEDAARAGGVYDGRGELRLRPASLGLERAEVPALLPSGELVDEGAPALEEVEEVDGDVEPPEDAADALVLGGDGAWRVLEAGVVAKGERALFRLHPSFGLSAARFDAEGERLLLACLDDAYVLSVEPRPRVLARYDLAPLAEVLDLPVVRGLDDEACFHLLARLGTRPAVAAADVEDIAAAAGLSRELAERVRAACEGASVPRRI